MGSPKATNRFLNACVVDTNRAEARKTSSALSKHVTSGQPAHVLASKEHAVAFLRHTPINIVIVDLECIGGEAELSEIVAAAPRAVMIAVSAKGSVSRAMNAMRNGAHDFLTKPYTSEMLLEKLEAHLGVFKRAAPSPSLSAATGSEAIVSSVTSGPAAQFEGFVGASNRMQSVYAQINRMATSSAPAFITGESGTGKELCAQALHARSARKGGPFVAINCGAIPANLMESEIFGHARGAFTGADEARAGAAELADGGTLFLDEIGEMELCLQSKLLRFLQTGSIQRVGEHKPRSLDLRVICATNRDPKTEITAGRFREDLFYRLHVLPIRLPALRERREDIPSLAQTFLKKYTAEENRRFQRFSTYAEALLLQHSWPGNVRELENVIRQLVVMNDGDEVTELMLSPLLRDQAVPVLSEIAFSTSEPMPSMGRSIEPLWFQEKQIIETTLETFDGNIALAAAALEISPSTIYRKKQSWAERAGA
ncbi:MULTISPECIES: sigma-54 dependent transcriptional regulator [unclassified Pseudovibrio]|uniref:sigma-54-dependent transcriptional regulator n=1 Tax=unclassified Pseudovibrio TaxID=2627060 RepID=UPI0007AEB1B5|nr:MULTISPECIES: sigma-54 dependent transcriptional regulator [unclassified Pseudovibrio]KZK94195.1 Luminescence regulatory protein LuxO [Pseudovibrio sp. W74]KZL09950.1 Luminescence regulatory protein LuxO [Pseudovibrio sp. Ad14]